VAEPTVFEFQRGDATWQKLRERCLTDLYWFAGVVLGYGDKVHMNPKVHGLLCKFLERSLGIPEIDECPHRKVMVFRDLGKTTIGTQARTLQRVLQNPEISVLITNERLENATKYLGAIKQEMMGNQLLRELFPDVIPQNDRETMWAEDRICVLRKSSRKEPTIYCIGTGGTVTGDHPDLIVCDDLFSREAMENARSGRSDMTGKLNRWISQLRPILSAWAKPYPEILFIGTPWYAGDPYEYVEEAFGYGEAPRTWQVTQRLPDGTTQVVALSRVGDLAIFKRPVLYEGRSIWPENPKLTDEMLAKFRMSDPELFAANMMLEPSDEVTATFKEHWLRFYDWLDNRTIRLHPPESKPEVFHLQDLDCLAFVDPGGFGSQRGADRMRPAISVTGTTPHTLRHCLLEAWSDQATYLQAINQLCAFATRYPLRKILVELAGQQAAFLELLKRTFKERGIDVLCEGVPVGNVEKDTRILELEPYFQRGEIFIGKTSAFSEWREQYRTFPRARRKDLLDSLAQGPKQWKKYSGNRQSHAQRQQAERERYYQQRGLTLMRSA
jgi:predicted phage terminase large subunit-like protein